MARRKRVFAWSPVRAFMKSNGAEMVARDAIEQLIYHLEVITKGMTDRALQFARHANRKKVTKEDIMLAIQYA